MVRSRKGRAAEESQSRYPVSRDHAASFVVEQEADDALQQAKAEFVFPRLFSLSIAKSDFKAVVKEVREAILR